MLQILQMFCCTGFPTRLLKCFDLIHNTTQKPKGDIYSWNRIRLWASLLALSTLLSTARKFRPMSMPTAPASCRMARFERSNRRWSMHCLQRNVRQRFRLRLLHNRPPLLSLLLPAFSLSLLFSPCSLPYLSPLFRLRRPRCSMAFLLMASLLHKLLDIKCL